MTPDMMLSTFIRRASKRNRRAPLAAAIVQRMATTRCDVRLGIRGRRARRDRAARAAFERWSRIPNARAAPRLARTKRNRQISGRIGFDDLGRAQRHALSYRTRASSPKSTARAVRYSNPGDRSGACIRRSAERVQGGWRQSANVALRELDLALIHDLLRTERSQTWQAIASVASPRSTPRLSAITTAQALLNDVVAERGEEGRAALRPVAESVLNKLAEGQIVRHIVFHLRKVDDADVEPLSRICHTIGPSVVGPLAFALASEESNRAIRRLRELLIGFGAAGRQSVEQLKNSSNPAVRRTAIDLLRIFGGREALPELASMLDDADPQVHANRSARSCSSQRRGIRGARTGSHGRRRLTSHGPAQLIGLETTKPFRSSATSWITRPSPQAGTLQPRSSMPSGVWGHPASTSTLRAVLHRANGGTARTAALRQAAAPALKRSDRRRRCRPP